MHERFTRWYVKRGYTFSVKDGRPVYGCPWWVRPFTFLISPSVYYINAFGKALADAFNATLIQSVERLNRMNRINTELNKERKE